MKLATASVAVMTAFCAAAVSVPAAADLADHTSAPGLNLGPTGLVETRTERRVAQGVTHTRIVRGVADRDARWIIELNIPSASVRPNPNASARSVQDRRSARRSAAKATAAGYPTTAASVTQPAVADLRTRVIGWRNRLDETFKSQSAATVRLADLKAAGFDGRVWYDGWDGDSTAEGPWTVNVLTIDPRTFRGELSASYGPNLADREKTTTLARLDRAFAAVNGGFFVFDPASGAEGDPAGAGVYDGTVLSEPVGDRPVLVLDPRARRTAVLRPDWNGSVRMAGSDFELDGINRVPGLIRNCGGTSDDLFTSEPLHDVTCTDADELVAFTAAFDERTPVGRGAEAVVNRQGRVVAVHPRRGARLTATQRSIQGTGKLARTVAELKRGEKVKITTALSDGKRNLARPGASVVNGGPLLLTGGRVTITQRQDGMRHASNPSFDYGWVLQRNPRTFAGIDKRGRTIFATVDGRQQDQLGLSIPETAAVARSLGMVDAINLDGGGSTAMVVDGRLVSSPSDTTGERAVGDAITIAPRR